MSDSFEDAERSLRRILEGAGGSANAYDDLAATKKAQPAPDDYEAAAASLQRILHGGPKTPNVPPSKPRSAPEHGLVVEEEGPSAEEEAAFRKDFHAAKAGDFDDHGEEDTLLEKDLPKGHVEELLNAIPRPIDPDYRYAGPVENAGEVYGIYNDFVDVLNGRKLPPSFLSGRTVAMVRADKEWRLNDEVKQLRYETDSAKTGVFVWVYHLVGLYADPIGYVQDGYVFIRR